jgi:uncharacterized phage protein (TIGR01671 family)
MREIKFRVWDIKRKSFREQNTYYNVTGISTCGKYLTRFSDHDSWDQPKGNALPIEEFIIQQYTGLKDKNNKEIYEGDIVEVGYGEHQGALGKVIFEYGSFMLTSKYGANFMDTYKSCLYGEVVGNIFENPELMN